MSFCTIPTVSPQPSFLLHVSQARRARHTLLNQIGDILGRAASREKVPPSIASSASMERLPHAPAQPGRRMQLRPVRREHGKLLGMVWSSQWAAPCSVLMLSQPESGPCTCISTVSFTKVWFELSGSIWKAAPYEIAVFVGQKRANSPGPSLSG